VPPSLSQPTGGRSIAAAFETAASSGRPGISPAALRPAPLQSRLGYLPKAVSAGPAIPRGRRSGRPSSGCAQAACEMAGVRAGYVRCPVRQRHSRSVHRRLRAASGMVSRGLVTTSITVSRRAFGGADQSNTEAIASGPNGINLRKPDGGNATANADSEIQRAR
jgi:hypothetical protein